MNNTNQTDSPWAADDFAARLVRGFAVGLQVGVAIITAMLVIAVGIDLVNVVTRAF